MPAVDPNLAKTFLVPFESAQQLKDWMFNFLGLDFPIGNVDPDSNTSPSEWMFEVYQAVRDNLGNEKPSWVVYSARESYKTLSCAAIEVVFMVHFGLTVAHMAAIESQSKKAVQYINSFMRKIEPYLNYHNRAITSQNTRNISLTNKHGDVAYLSVIVCTMQGANSEHTNIMVVDEVDVVRFPTAYEEAKLIPGMLNGRHPITIMISTRKFAFGMMAKEIESARENGWPILHWNIIDITEKCQPERHRPDLPKVTRFIHSSLPLRNIGQEQYSDLPEEKRAEYKKIEAFSGCATCKLLPVCQTRLANRPDTDVGGLYKPIDFTINQFHKVSPDMGEAQLMTWKPSSVGLIYPRFDDHENVLTLQEAWSQFMGSNPPKDLTLNDLIYMMHDRGIRFYAGVDWGYRHNFAINIGAIMPSGDFWIPEIFAMPGLEFPDMMKNAEHFRDKYKVKKWFCDTAQPMFITSFRKHKMPCADFAKDIMGGIESIRGQIVDAGNRRRLKVLDTPENQFLIKAFKTHHFKLDAAGNPTTDPDDEEYADTMDAMRYMGQNLFKVKPKDKGTDDQISKRERQLRIQREKMYNNDPQKVHSQFISQQIQTLTNVGSGSTKGKSDSGSVLWDFSDPFIGED